MSANSLENSSKTIVGETRPENNTEATDETHKVEEINPAPNAQDINLYVNEHIQKAFSSDEVDRHLCKDLITDKLNREINNQSVAESLKNLLINESLEHVDGRDKHAHVIKDIMSNIKLHDNDVSEVEKNMKEERKPEPSAEDITSHMNKHMEKALYSDKAQRHLSKNQITDKLDREINDQSVAKSVKKLLINESLKHVDERDKHAYVVKDIQSNVELHNNNVRGIEENMKEERKPDPSAEDINAHMDEHMKKALSSDEVDRHLSKDLISNKLDREISNQSVAKSVIKMLNDLNAIPSKVEMHDIDVRTVKENTKEERNPDPSADNINAHVNEHIKKAISTDKINQLSTNQITDKLDREISNQSVAKSVKKLLSTESLKHADQQDAHADVVSVIPSNVELYDIDVRAVEENTKEERNHDPSAEDINAHVDKHMEKALSSDGVDKHLSKDLIMDKLDREISNQSMAKALKKPLSTASLKHVDVASVIPSNVELYDIDVRAVEENTKERNHDPSAEDINAHVDEHMEKALFSDEVDRHLSKNLIMDKLGTESNQSMAKSFKKPLGTASLKQSNMASVIPSNVELYDDVRAVEENTKEERNLDPTAEYINAHVDEHMERAFSSDEVDRHLSKDLITEKLDREISNQSVTKSVIKMISNDSLKLADEHEYVENAVPSNVELHDNDVREVEEYIKEEIITAPNAQDINSHVDEQMEKALSTDKIHTQLSTNQITDKLDREISNQSVAKSLKNLLSNESVKHADEHGDLVNAIPSNVEVHDVREVQEKIREERNTDLNAEDINAHVDEHVKRALPSVEVNRHLSKDLITDKLDREISSQSVAKSVMQILSNESLKYAVEHGNVAKVFPSNVEVLENDVREVQENIKEKKNPDLNAEDINAHVDEHVEKALSSDEIHRHLSTHQIMDKLDREISNQSVAKSVIKMISTKSLKHADERDKHADVANVMPSNVELYDNDVRAAEENMKEEINTDPNAQDINSHVYGHMEEAFSFDKVDRHLSKDLIIGNLNREISNQSVAKSVKKLLGTESLKCADEQDIHANVANDILNNVDLYDKDVRKVEENIKEERNPHLNAQDITAHLDEHMQKALSFEEVYTHLSTHQITDKLNREISDQSVAKSVKKLLGTESLKYADEQDIHSNVANDILSKVELHAKDVRKVEENIKEEQNPDPHTQDINAHVNEQMQKALSSDAVDTHLNTHQITNKLDREISNQSVAKSVKKLLSTASLKHADERDTDAGVASVIPSNVELHDINVREVEENIREERNPHPNAEDIYAHVDEHMEKTLFSDEVDRHLSKDLITDKLDREISNQSVAKSVKKLLSNISLKHADKHGDVANVIPSNFKLHDDLRKVEEKMREQRNPNLNAEDINAHVDEHVKKALSSDEIHRYLSKDLITDKLDREISNQSVAKSVKKLLSKKSLKHADGHGDAIPSDVELHENDLKETQNMDEPQVSSEKSEEIKQEIQDTPADEADKVEEIIKEEIKDALEQLDKPTDDENVKGTAKEDNSAVKDEEVKTEEKETSEDKPLAQTDSEKQLDRIIDEELENMKEEPSTTPKETSKDLTQVEPIKTEIKPEENEVPQEENMQNKPNQKMKEEINDNAQEEVESDDEWKSAIGPEESVGVAKDEPLLEGYRAGYCIQDDVRFLKFVANMNLVECTCNRVQNDFVLDLNDSNCHLKGCPSSLSPKDVESIKILFLTKHLPVCKRFITANEREVLKNILKSAPYYQVEFFTQQQPYVLQSENDQLVKPHMLEERAFPMRSDQPGVPKSKKTILDNLKDILDPRPQSVDPNNNRFPREEYKFGGKYEEKTRKRAVDINEYPYDYPPGPSTSARPNNKDIVDERLILNLLNDLEAWRYFTFICICDILECSSEDFVPVYNPKEDQLKAKLLANVPPEQQREMLAMIDRNLRFFSDLLKKQMKDKIEREREYMPMLKDGKLKKEELFVEILSYRSKRLDTGNVLTSIVNDMFKELMQNNKEISNEMHEKMSREDYLVERNINNQIKKRMTQGDLKLGYPQNDIFERYIKNLMHDNLQMEHDLIRSEMEYELERCNQITLRLFQDVLNNLNKKKPVEYDHIDEYFKSLFPSVERASNPSEVSSLLDETSSTYWSNKELITKPPARQEMSSPATYPGPPSFECFDESKDAVRNYDIEEVPREKQTSPNEKRPPSKRDKGTSTLSQKDTRHPETEDRATDMDNFYPEEVMRARDHNEQTSRDRNIQGPKRDHSSRRQQSSKSRLFIPKRARVESSSTEPFSGASTSSEPLPKPKKLRRREVLSKPVRPEPQRPELDRPPVTDLQRSRETLRKEIDRMMENLWNLEEDKARLIREMAEEMRRYDLAQQNPQEKAAETKKSYKEFKKEIDSKLKPKPTRSPSAPLDNRRPHGRPVHQTVSSTTPTKENQGQVLSLYDADHRYLIVELPMADQKIDLFHDLFHGQRKSLAEINIKAERKQIRTDFQIKG